MNIGIIGPGAIGLVMAYFIEKGDLRPTLFYKSKYKASYVKRMEGPVVKIGDNEYKLSSTISYLGFRVKEKYDVLIVSTKAYDVDDVIGYIDYLIKDDGLVISVQNGIGSLEDIEKKIDPSNVAAAVITFGATRYGYAKSELKGRGEIILGQRVKKYNKYLYYLRDYLRSVRLDVRITRVIDAYRWLKVIVNSSIGPITSIFRVKNGAILELKEARELVDMVINEGENVVKAMNIKLPRDPRRETYKIIRSTSDNYSSMLQDILSKRRTEIDYINGAIVKYGERLNIQTPINKTLIYIVKGLSRL
jgi:2-dehydropantoate 2-reductase